MGKTSYLWLEVGVVGGRRLSLQNTFKGPIMEVDGKKVSTYQLVSVIMKLWLPKITKSYTQLEISSLPGKTFTSLHAPTASEDAHGPKSLPNFNMVVQTQLP